MITISNQRYIDGKWNSLYYHSSVIISCLHPGCLNHLSCEKCGRIGGKNKVYLPVIQDGIPRPVKPSSTGAISPGISPSMESLDKNKTLIDSNVKISPGISPFVENKKSEYPSLISYNEMMDIINESKKYNTFSPVIYPSNDKISPENLPFTEALAKSITTTGVKVLHDAEINGMFVNNEKVKDYKLCTFTKKLVIFTYHKNKE